MGTARHADLWLESERRTVLIIMSLLTDFPITAENTLTVVGEERYDNGRQAVKELMLHCPPQICV